MNILLDKLPTAVEVGGKMYDIHTDFRTAIKLELLISDMEMDDGEKILQIILLYFDGIEAIPKDLEQTIAAIMDFYRCGKDNVAESGTGANRRAKIYSFEYDAPYIYAAFLEQYGIDLTQEVTLHWWRFKAMFDSLSDTTQFVKIMGYRSMVITNDMSPQQKEFYRRMQKTYAIPISKIEKEKTNELEEALFNGGDISGLL